MSTSFSPHGLRQQPPNALDARLRQVTPNSATPFIGMDLSGSNNFSADRLFPPDAKPPATIATAAPTAAPPPSESAILGTHPKRTIVRMVEVGPCVSLLMKFNNEQRRGQVTNSLEEFWKPFVRKYFAPNARILLDIVKSQNTSSHSIQLPVDAMPRILKSKYDAGVQEDRMLMEMPYEFLLENGQIVVDCPRTTVLTQYPHSKVCTDGHLRVSFTAKRKIICWEFTMKKHEELFTRDYIPRGHLPEPVCTPYGIPKSAVLFYTIAESVYDMAAAIDSRMEAMANGNNANHQLDTTNRSKDPNAADKETPNIISQLNETVSTMMPEKSKLSAAQTAQLGMAPDFGIGMTGQSGVNQFEISQPNSAVAAATAALQQSSTNAQIQLAQFQSQQRMRSQQALLQPAQAGMNVAAQARIHPESIRTMQTSPIPPDLMSGVLDGSLRNPNANSAAAAANQVRGGASVTDALLSAQWSGTLGTTAANAFFGTENGTVDQDNNDAVSAVKSTTGAPAGLSMFEPTANMNIGADMFGPSGSGARNEGGAQNTAQNAVMGEALSEGIDGFPFDILSNLNGGASAAGASRPMPDSTNVGVTLTAAAAGAGGSKRGLTTAQDNATAVPKASKRRRGV